MKNGICPYCEDFHSLEEIRNIETINIRGLDVDVESYRLKCTACCEEFEDPESDFDFLATAYNEYREIKGLMQPFEIREMRGRYDLTQKDLTSLLGWGQVTISRYENGALQSESHDKILRILDGEVGMISFLEKESVAERSDKLNNLLKTLRGKRKKDPKSLFSMLNLEAARSVSDLNTGYSHLRIEKLKSMVLWFCRIESQAKTKLNKLLFYSDFVHFAYNGIGISGVKYYHLPHGPVPNRYELFYCMLTEEKPGLVVREQSFSEYVWEEFFTVGNTDDLQLDTSEIETLKYVWKQVGSLSSTGIRELSHCETAYSHTKNGEAIPYHFSKELSII